MSNEQNNISNTVVHDEPSEHDPCMEKTKNTKKTNFFHTYVHKISDKSGLKEKGVYIVGSIIVFAVLLVIIVLALGISWPRIPHKYQFPVCTDSQCLHTAAQIRDSLASTVSPCEDLWTAMCGGWLEKNPLPKDKSIWNPKQILDKSEAEHVRDLIATLKLPVNYNTIEWKLKTFYDSCMNIDNINNEKDFPLTNYISELGGWYILDNWTEMAFDKNELLMKLLVKFGVSPYFRISVEPNPNMPGEGAVRISPAGLGLPDREYYYRNSDDRIQVAYKEFIRDSLIYLRAPRREATKFANDIFSYEKRIAEITPPRQTLLNPITTFNVISLSELKDTNMIPLFDIIQAMYPESNINDNTEVIVTSVEYLAQIAQIIATTDRRTMNGYMMWTLVRNYIPFLSEQFMSAYHTFKSELYGIQEPLERWELCSNLLREYMGLGTEYLREKSTHTLKEKFETVSRIFLSIKDVITSKIEIKDAKLLGNYVFKKLKDLNLLVGLNETVFNGTFVKEYYLPLTIIKSNYFENIKNAKTFRKDIEEKMLRKTLLNEQLLSYQGLSTSIKYLPSENAIIVPRSRLLEPLMSPNYANSILFGRLGVEIAEGIISSILPYGSLWTSNRKILSPFHMTVNESFEFVQPSIKCLEKYILNLNLDIPYSVANETSLKILTHISAVIAANEALKFIQQNAAHVHQPTLEDYEDDALFFVSYAQMQCSRSTSQNDLFEKLINFDLAQRTRLLVLWSQIPNFSNALGCSSSKKTHCTNIFQ